MNPLWLAPVLAVFLGMVLEAQAETETVNVEGGMEVEIAYPGEIVAGREGIVSILVRNNGWEDKQDISFAFSLPDVPSITVDPPGGITIDRLAQGGSYGKNVSLRVAEEVRPGVYFLNTRYTHVLVANNETPQEPFMHDIAIPITIKEDARVTIIASTPESIFANAQFPIDVKVVSEDITITDVRVRMVPPDDVEFLGETLHAFSRIERDAPVEITAQMVTPAEVDTEYRIPFEIVVEYTDDVGDEKADSQTVSLILRPRTFMELTSDGGIWVGDFFIAPYVSVGTIVGVPAGTIMTLLIRRRYADKRRD